MYKGTLIDDLIATVARAEGQDQDTAELPGMALAPWYELSRHEMANLDSLAGVA
ncbi:MAG: hypothetical protein NVS1B11_22490 [Terriglobales bacterium]